MNLYANVTIKVDGKPLARTRVEVGERREGLVFGDDASGAPPRSTVSFTATCKGLDALKAFVAMRPVETPAVKMTIPWSILGQIEIVGWLDESEIAQTAEGTTTRLRFIPHAKSLRHAVSVAVQNAIMHRPARSAAVSRAALGKDAALHALADTVLRKRGERKKRKAMRRLLRAAGATRGGA